jgi:hypothetical protein
MKHYLLAVVAMLVALSGCTDTPESPAGRGSIRAIHAADDIGTVTFLIEARQLEQLEFQRTGDFVVFDSLTYDFNFDFFDRALGDTVRLGRTSVSVEPDTNYTLVLSGSGAAPRVQTWERPDRRFSESDTVFELYVGHLATTVANIDVYVGEVGFDPLAATPVLANIARDSVTDVVEFELGVYEIVVTTAGDPADVLFRSGEAPLVVPDTVLMAVHDSAGENTGDLTVVLAGRSVRATLVDAAAPTLLRFANGVRSAGAVDVYLDGDFTMPFAAAVDFGVATALDAVPGNEIVTLATTPAGDPGVTLTEGELGFTNGSVNTAVLVGSGDTLATIAASSNLRPLFNVGKLSLINASTLYDRLDVFITEPGADLTTEAPIVAGVSPGISVGTVQLAPGEYELTLSESFSDAPVFGPVPLTVTASGFQSLVIANAADGVSLELIDIGAPQP